MAGSVVDAQIDRRAQFGELPVIEDAGVR